MDEDDYGPRSSSQRNSSKRSAPLNSQGSISGSQKRVMGGDDDDNSDQDNSHTPAAIRQTIQGSKVSMPNVPPEEYERFIKDTVRLAIFSSHSEAGTLKRDDIKARNHGKLYDNVFDRAQDRLRNIFGMEMVELTTKGRSGKNDEKGTKSYILRNTLPQDLLATDAIDWDDQLEDQGLLMVILSLIMVREGAIFESQLKQHFRRLMLTGEGSDIEKKMEMFIKRRYLEKSKLEYLNESGEKVEMEIRWGSRARAEIPEENVVQFIEEVFGPDAPKTLRESIVKASGIKPKAQNNDNAGSGVPSSNGASAGSEGNAIRL
ncbi:Melanoma-associated antigen D2 [Linnemannia zychae]|nr:Melanoma-associated antigen D2 [Linnemannia zychae]